MHRVLIIRLSHMGDIILTEPVARAVKTVMPDCHVEFLTKSIYADVVGMLDAVDSVTTLEIPGPDSSIRGLSKAIRRLGNDRYDFVFDLHSNIRSWLVKHQVNAKKILTYPKNWRARKRAIRKKKRTSAAHTLDLYTTVLDKAGIEVQGDPPRVAIHQEALGEATELLTGQDIEPGKYCVLAVGASHPAKHYPIPQWVDLAGAIVDKFGLKVVVVEKEYLDYLNLFDELKDSGNAAIMTELNIRVLGAVLEQSRFCISNDSGVMHLSAATGAPTLGLFGPTHPSLGFAPLGDRCGAVTVNESCSPCSKHGESPCYREERFCFTRMTTDIILQNLKEVMQNEN